MNKGKIKSHPYKIAIIICIIFISILILNSKTLYISDDFLYRFELAEGVSDDELQPIKGLMSIIRSQYHHYSSWNGRFVPHTIVQFVLQFDKWLFNIGNSMMYVYLGLLVAKIVARITRSSIDVYTLISIYILMFILIPSFGQTVLWISGAVNYLWMSVIYLSFYYYNIEARKDNAGTIIKASLLGFLAGATNENSGPAIILMVILLAIYSYYKDKKIYLWRITGIITSLIGFALILFAPAAAKRVAERNEVSISLSVLFKKIEMINSYLLKNYWIFFTLIILLLFILLLKNIITTDILINISFLIIGFLGSTYSLIAIDKIIKRTMFGPVMLMIIITSVLIKLSFDCIYNKKILLIGLIPTLLLYVSLYSIVFLDINETYKTVSQQYDIIYSQPNEHVTVPMIEKPKTDYNAYSQGTNYLKKDKNAWLNKWASRFFGVKSISGS